MVRRKKTKSIKFRSKPKPVRKVLRLRSPNKAKSGITSIKVVGIGGGGGNAITRMMEGNRMRGVEFLAINTDTQDLDNTLAHRKIYIGKALTRGLGAGMNPDIGKQAAEENRSEIIEALEGTDIVFLTAGFGGGTGTGATPVIAETAKEKNILTVAIVTKPFSFEGADRLRIAQEGLGDLKDKVDALVVIPNDRIFSLINKDTSVARAFSLVDDVLKQAVGAIADLINAAGIINVDFSDIKTIIKDSGETLIGIGVASGPDRGLKATKAAINSPLLEISIDGAKRVLFSISGGKDLKMTEINEVAKVVSANLDSNAKIIFGAYYDRSLKDKSIKVTVIATGFNGLMGNSRLGMPSLFLKDESKEGAIDIKDEESEKEENEKEENIKDKKKVFKKWGSQKSESEWDIPAFLRRKKKR